MEDTIQTLHFEEERELSPTPLSFSQAEFVAERCGHSKPLNNRPFMMPCNAMMILLCPPPSTLHQPPQLHRNVVQQVTRSTPPPPPPPPPPPRCRHHHRYHRHHLTTPAAIATEAPLPQIKKTKMARNYRGGNSADRAQREDSCSLTYTPREKRGGPI
ncbi:hypothetical protein INR49_030951 [Caranx melampygus]|nr:hypothetical protein INR49_030951 [Caranx melampygus]